MQAGWFIIDGHKWGFLLNVKSLSEAYQGILLPRWKLLLQTEFFIDIVERFNYFFEEEKEDDEEEKEREIVSTDSDEPLPDWYVPINQTLFVH